MKLMQKIGILDNGIDQKRLERDVENKVIIDDTVADRTGEIDLSVCEHGTICALIIEKYLEDCSLHCVKILDEKGEGNLNNMSIALDYYNISNIHIINNSMGTTYFQDKTTMRKIINHYGNKGFIIVAAASNDGFITYPASFSNVIGVEAGESFYTDQDKQFQKGVDFIAPSNHKIIIEGFSFYLGKSNSYATPYVVSMVGKLIGEKGIMSIDDMRALLADKRTTFVYSPDWIEKAWISPLYVGRRTEFYFDVECKELSECIEDIDTLVLCDSTEINEYRDLKKHIVYLGNEIIKSLDNGCRFWGIETRRIQIISSKKKNGVIDIPVICCVFDKEADIIKEVCKLKNLFECSGYNAFTGCNLVDSPLYDIEYLPYDLVIPEKLDDFIYWQTYYQQSDLIIIGTKSGVDLSMLHEEGFDMRIDFKYIDESIVVAISIDGVFAQEIMYSCIDEEAIKGVYKFIIDRYEKKEDK